MLSSADKFSNFNFALKLTKVYLPLAINPIAGIFFFAFS